MISLTLTYVDVESIFDLMGLTPEQAYDFWTVALETKLPDGLADLANGGIQRSL